MIYYLKNLILFIIKPFSRWIGKVNMPWVSKERIFRYFYDIEDNLKEGDILLSSSYGHLSYFFIKTLSGGKYTHAFMYIGKENGRHSIVEAVGEGIRIQQLAENLASKDMICILRPKKELVNESQIKKAIEFAKSKVGKKYDFLFDMSEKRGNEEYFCSELVYEAYYFGNPDMKFERWDRDGVKTVSPVDFYKARNHFDLIMEIK